MQMMWATLEKWGGGGRGRDSSVQTVKRERREEEEEEEEEEEVWDRIFMSDSEEKEVKVERGESSNKKYFKYIQKQRKEVQLVCVQVNELRRVSWASSDITLV